MRQRVKLRRWIKASIRKTWELIRSGLGIGIIFLVIAVLAFWLSGSRLEELRIDAIAVLFDIGITVIFVDMFYRRRDEEREKRHLILQMGSPHNEVALEGVLKLRARGWMSDGSLRGANFFEANLSGAYLSGADLSGAKLDLANLSEANFISANLSGVHLIGANLSGASLIHAELSKACLFRTDLSKACICDADLSRADLRDADLSDADLSGTNLSGANLLSVNLSGADLQGANLSDTNLERANVRNVFLDDYSDFKGANLEGAQFDASAAELLKKHQFLGQPIFTNEE